MTDSPTAKAQRSHSTAHCGSSPALLGGGGCLSNLENYWLSDLRAVCDAYEVAIAAITSAHSMLLIAERAAGATGGPIGDAAYQIDEVRGELIAVHDEIKTEISRRIE